MIANEVSGDTQNSLAATLSLFYNIDFEHGLKSICSVLECSDDFTLLLGALCLFRNMIWSAVETPNKH